MNGAPQYGYHDQHDDPSHPFLEPAFVPPVQPVGDQPGHHHDPSTAPHLTPGIVFNDILMQPNTTPSPRPRKPQLSDAADLPKPPNASKPTIPANPDPLQNTSTGPTHPTSASSPQNASDGETSAQPSNPGSQNEQPNGVLPDKQDKAASDTQQGFLPPLDMGPGAVSFFVVTCKGIEITPV